MVAAGLPEHPVLNAADDGVEHLHIRIVTSALDAAVVLALGEGVQRGRHLGDQLLLAAQAAQHHQHIEQQRQQQRREYQHILVAKEDGKPCYPDSGKKQKSAILKLIDGVESFLSLGIFPGIHMHASDAGDLKILLREGQHAAVRRAQNTSVGVVQAEGNVPVVVGERLEDAYALLPGFILHRRSARLTDQADSILNILVLFLSQNRAALGQQNAEQNQ